MTCPPRRRLRPNVLVQDFSHAVVPLTALKLRGPLLEADFGTGFCLDADCQFIGTNYHVAAVLRHLRVKGASIVERYLATGPKDEGASLNHFAFAGSPPLRYTLSRDLAILQLSKPLPHHHGLHFSSDDLPTGQESRDLRLPEGNHRPNPKSPSVPREVQGHLGRRSFMVFDYVPNRGELIPVRARVAG